MAGVVIEAAGGDDRVAAIWAEYGQMQPQVYGNDAVAERPRRDVVHQNILSVLQPDTEPSSPTERNDWRGLVEQYADWSPAEMMKILRCESHDGTDPNMAHGLYIGPWQIAVSHGYLYDSMMDPALSTQIAHEIWLQSGYGAWECA